MRASAIPAEWHADANQQLAKKCKARTTEAKRKWCADANQQLAKKCKARTTEAKRKWCADANQQLAGKEMIFLGETKATAIYEAKFFDKWDTQGIQIRDIGLARYISLETKIIPHTFGKRSRKRFEKAKIPIVERLINKIMRSGQGKRKLSGKYIRGRNSCGKKIQALEIVEKAFERIERETKQNPVQSLIRAIENAAQREDITRMKKGGIAYTVAVDVAPMKRLDEALKNIALAAFSGSFNNRKSADEALAEEIILAAKGDSKALSIKRRDEVERIAKSSR